MRRPEGRKGLLCLREAWKPVWLEQKEEEVKERKEGQISETATGTSLVVQWLRTCL